MKIETEYILFLKIETELNYVSHKMVTELNSVSIFRNGIYFVSIFTHKKLIFIIHNKIFK